MGFLINILIDIAIFNIIYSIIHSGTGYLKTVIIYAVCLDIKQLLMQGMLSFSLFIYTFVLFFIVALILIGILNKVEEYFTRILFIVTAIVLENIIVLTVGPILAMAIFIICL